MIKSLSHLVIATNDVPSQTKFFEDLFNLKPHYSNEEFTEFVLPSKSRIAFFKPTGKTKQFFNAEGDRSTTSYGVTVENVDAVHEKAKSLNLKVSGPPKTHPWGEKSFLLIDPDGNRWEVTQSPTAEGHLVDLPS